MKNNPRNDYVPNQGCGIFFLMVLSVFLLLSIPVLKFNYELFFEKHVLLTSDSPHDNYHIEISRKGESVRFLIEEDTTSSALSSSINTELLMPVTSENLEIEWINDELAYITATGRNEIKSYFCFNADAEKEKIKEIVNDSTWNEYRALPAINAPNLYSSR
ncbi:hypothetical protein [Jeotgalibaca ciconiae]|uniref:Uncharacterized protein n=1 Tax=Jeotgalibaca ciconiae TaxID=2496265 RepID=A0A3S9HAY8_9LACT|nr:hypothetical protein [Jeotgalibaca ciconiae]AZP04333.1 hypothetical protein EJN90_06575 [Jeotgalibaca ciconiae]HJB24919.1 hypothetical protein [Candidatus Jeotgalibaca pullicola]